jgi:uncharacterized protein YegP (UPF0339 family)
MNNAKFEVHKAHDGEYYFLLRANNGEIVAVSETYTTKQNCLKGINAVVEIVRSMQGAIEVSDRSEI